MGRGNLKIVWSKSRSCKANENVKITCLALDLYCLNDKHVVGVSIDATCKNSKLCRILLYRDQTGDLIWYFATGSLTLRRASAMLNQSA